MLRQVRTKGILAKMDMGTKKQTVIVTGALSVIGKAVVRYFLAQGDNVLINASNVERLAEVSPEISGGENLVMVAGNLADRITGIKLLSMAVARFGSADVLVNTPDVFETRTLLDMDDAYLGRLFASNLKGALFTTQAIIPQMIKQRRGVVINIGTPLVSYALDGAAADFSKYNIRFNSIALGTADTSWPGGKTDANGGAYLFNEGEAAKDIAHMVFELARCKSISGSVIKVEGAWAPGRELK